MSGRALVLGAGISGLAAAHRLRRDGFDVTVLEAAERPGGTWCTVAREHFRFELGPNTVLRSPELDALCRAAGCAEGLRDAAPAAKRRYLLRDGALVALPSGPPGLLTTPLLSWRGKLRLVAGALVGGFRPRTDDTVARYFARTLGREAAPLVDALVTGVFAGDPDELLLSRAFPRLFRAVRRHGGTLFRALRSREGPRPPMVGYRGGFAHLARDLAEPIDVRYGARATAVEAAESGFRVRWEAGGETTAETAAHVVTALPAAATAAVLHPIDDDLAAITAVPHAPVAVVALGFRRQDVGHRLDGFGFLAPHLEGCDVLGCLFVSTLFPDAAPAGHIALVAMVGGRRRAALVDQDDGPLLRRTVDALRPLLGLRGAPVVGVVHRWRPGIPQPDTALDLAIHAADRLEGQHPGLEILGGWRHGVGVPDCVRAGWCPPDVDTLGGRP